MQECFYLKAVMDKKLPSVVARLAKQTQIMYDEVERLLTRSRGTRPRLA